MSIILKLNPNYGEQLQLHELSGMALQISTLFSYVRALPGTAAPLLRVRANYHGASVKFSHSVGPQSPQQAVNPATGPVLGIIKKFTTTAALGSSSQGNRFSSPQQRGGWFWLGKITQAAVLGVSSVALIVSFHTGSLAAMARKVNLNSAEGDWKETKGETKQLLQGSLFK